MKVIKKPRNVLVSVKLILSQLKTQIIVHFQNQFIHACLHHAALIAYVERIITKLYAHVSQNLLVILRIVDQSVF